MPTEKLVGPIQQMISALAVEIAEIKKRGGSQSLEVAGGERRGEVEGRTLYAFPIGEDVFAREDAPIRILVGQQEVNGVVVSVGENTLVLALDEDLGPRISVARLILDDSFLLERLKAKLEEVSEGRASFNHAKASQSIGNSPIRTGEVAVRQGLIDGLNPKQGATVRRALGSEVTYLWGPPGTGKTTTLARVVQAYYEAGKSVLLVSNTNVAVDTALEKICIALETDLGFQQGAVLRLGPLVKPELEQGFRDRIVLEKVIARLGEGLRNEREEQVRKQVALDREQDPIWSALVAWGRLGDLRLRKREATERLERLRAEADSKSRDLTGIQQRLSEKRQDLERASGMGKIGRFFRGLDPDRLRREITQLGVEEVSHRDVLHALERQLNVANEAIQHLDAELEPLEREARAWPPERELKAEEARIRAALDAIRAEIRRIDDEIASLRSRVIGSCRVVAATAYQSYLNPELTRSFDVAVIDEASMLPLPLGYYVSGRATEHVVIAGDFRQLPPIVTTRDETALDWLKRDLFEKSGIAESVSRGQHPDALVALTTQHRMRKPVCDLINEIWYQDNPLETAPSISGMSTPHSSIGCGHLFLVDTSGLNPWCAVRTGTYSRYNILHALVARNLAWALAGGTQDSNPKSVSERVGIVAPYSAQAKLIAALIQEDFGERTAPVSATVHRFQGNEKTAMIVDLTDSTGTRVGQFVTPRELVEDGARLLNVALSRAREQVVLIANVAYLRSKTPSDGITRRVLDHFEANAVRLDGEEILSRDPRGWVDALRVMGAPAFDFDPARAGWFSEGTFFGAFARDIRSARKSIVIFSPFLTGRGAARLADELRQRVSEGVQVRLVTRPQGDQGGVLDEGIDEHLAGLEKLGVVVDRRNRLHEKIAMIDGRVLWFGSLNIFSHRDTTESMLRIPSSRACQQVIDFLLTPEKRGGQPGTAAPGGIAAQENPACPNCGGVTVWYNGRYGIYYKCAAQGCGGTVDPRRQRRSQSDNPKRQSRGGRGTSAPRQSRGACPDCGGQLKLKKGRFGEFVGCSNYPRCRHTSDA